MRLTPYSKKIICDDETPISLFLRLTEGHAYAFLLESAELHNVQGRYSIIGFDPLILVEFPAASVKNPLKHLQKIYESIEYTPMANMPRLQAPFVGYFSYETARFFENIKLPQNKNGVPDCIFFLPKKLVIFDHFAHSATLIAFNKKDLNALELHMREETTLKIPKLADSPAENDKTRKKTVPGDFTKIIDTAKKKICAGEIFQIVISRLFTKKTKESDINLYRRLRTVSPSPYMYFLKYPQFSIVGSSPETLVRTEGDQIIIRPIAGTRKRGLTEKDDAVMAQELISDEKEQAEHMMLVDLGRHDIGRVSKPGSVKVTQLMKLEKFSHVMHLVSEIRGRRAKSTSVFDVFRTAFPAGTLTGAPKIRAMQIIADLEKIPRGIYGGAVGYFDLSGNIDFAIAIRTMLYKSGEVSIRAGAGIVYDSQAKYEYKECLNKASAPLSTLP